MNSNYHNSQFKAASFFTSFINNEAKPSFGLPIGLPANFLKSPSWQTVTTKKPTARNKKTKQQQKEEFIQQAMYILPKSPSSVSIYLQLPKFRSLSVLLRCGHVSQLVENWLCNPMDQLKKNAKQYYQPVIQKPSLRIMSSGSTPATDERSLVPFRSSLLSFHFQVDQQIQTMEVKYDYTPCLYTIVCLTYKCGSVSLSVNQIETLDFLLSATTMDPFLVKCDLLPNHPVDVHHLREPGSYPLLCDYADNDRSFHIEEPNSPLLICNDVYHKNIPSITECSQEEEDTILLYEEHLNVNSTDAHIGNLKQQYQLQETEKLLLSHESEYLHLKETMLYHQEEDDDQSWIYSSSEEYSVLDDLDTDQEEQEKDSAQISLLNLVRDTLEYIQSSGGALSEELNMLEYKLYNYCRVADAIYE